MAKVLFFGKLSDAGSPMDMALPDGVSTTADLTLWLGNQNEALKDALDSPGVFMAVNQEIVRQDTHISDDDEIAYMSALSGG